MQPWQWRGVRQNLAARRTLTELPASPTVDSRRNGGKITQPPKSGDQYAQVDPSVSA
jgi:hypothetical protein